MKVVVEPEARAEILLIRQMIALGGEWAAARWSRKIDDYRLWYRLTDDRIRVVAVWDARRGTLPETTREAVEPYRVAEARCELADRISLKRLRPLVRKLAMAHQEMREAGRLAEEKMRALERDMSLLDRI